MQDAYEGAIGAQLDFMFDSRMGVFEEVCAVPVLLSLLTVVLGSSCGAANKAMPQDLYELYSSAIEEVLVRRLDEADISTAHKMLRNVACRNHLGGVRTFTDEDVANALGDNEDQVKLWNRVLYEDAGVPVCGDGLKLMSSSKCITNFLTCLVGCVDAVVCTARQDTHTRWRRRVSI